MVDTLGLSRAEGPARCGCRGRARCRRSGRRPRPARARASGAGRSALRRADSATNPGPSSAITRLRRPPATCASIETAAPRAWCSTFVSASDSDTQRDGRDLWRDLGQPLVDRRASPAGRAGRTGSAVPRSAGCSPARADAAMMPVRSRPDRLVRGGRRRRADAPGLPRRPLRLGSESSRASSRTASARSCARPSWTSAASRMRSRSTAVRSSSRRSRAASMPAPRRSPSTRNTAAAPALTAGKACAPPITTPSRCARVPSGSSSQASAGGVNGCSTSHSARSRMTSGASPCTASRHASSSKTSRSRASDTRRRAGCRGDTDEHRSAVGGRHVERHDVQPERVPDLVQRSLGELRQRDRGDERVRCAADGAADIGRARGRGQRAHGHDLRYRRRRMPVRVLIADDHRLMREGTAALLAADERIEVVGLAARRPPRPWRWPSAGDRTSSCSISRCPASTV